MHLIRAKEKGTPCEVIEIEAPNIEAGSHKAPEPLIDRREALPEEVDSTKRNDPLRGFELICISF